MSRAARRAFCPSRPMARESLSSGTTAMADFSSTCVTETTLAGESALAMNSRGFSLHRMMSTFSPPSSSTTAFTRAPLLPTHAPTASTCASSLKIAILVRCPASREMDLMTTAPDLISGTSISNRRLTKPAAARDTRTCALRPLFLIFFTYTFRRWLTSYFSPGT